MLMDAANQHPDHDEIKHKRKKRDRYLGLFTLFLFALGLIAFCLWFFYFRFYQSTDDAYVNGSMVNINAVVPGSVTAFYADNTDLVMEGQMADLIDPLMDWEQQERRKGKPLFFEK